VEANKKIGGNRPKKLEKFARGESRQRTLEITASPLDGASEKSVGMSTGARILLEQCGGCRKGNQALQQRKRREEGGKKGETVAWKHEKGLNETGLKIRK